MSTRRSRNGLIGNYRPCGACASCPRRFHIRCRVVVESRRTGKGPAARAEPIPPTGYIKILEARFLLPLSQLFMVIAVLAWAATFAGLVDSRLNRLWRPQSSD